MNIEIEKVLLRQSDFLQHHGIEVWTKKEVGFFLFLFIFRSLSWNHMHCIYLWILTRIVPQKVKSVDTEAKTLTFKDGTVQHYDQLLISTGGRSDHNFRS